MDRVRTCKLGFSFLYCSQKPDSPTFTFAHLPLLALLARSGVAQEGFGLAAQLFQLSTSSSVDNAKLRWAIIEDATDYLVLRSVDSGSYSQIDSLHGDSYDDYGLAVGSTYDYQITALNGVTSIGTSEVVSLQPFSPSGSYNTYSNIQGSNLDLQSNLYADGVYYQYNYESFSNGSMEALVQQTSSNGYSFSGNTVVLTGQTVCASVGYSCLLQRIDFEKNPVTGDFVMWAHLENTANYDLAQVAVAYATPGQAFTFAGTYRPLDYDSRDETFFVDGDDGYLISATDTNTNMNIYALTSNWTAVASLVQEVYIDDYREAPSMVKYDGYYYLFTSRAAGWYPSQPEYIAAQSLTGPWSNPVVVGNTATFCSQSGSVMQLNNGQFAMISSVWAANWSPSAGANYDLFLPTSFSPSGGYASYNYYEQVAYSDQITTVNQAVYGIQAGQILSNTYPATTNAGTTNLAYANDGTQDNPNQTWVPDTFPFWYQIDLGADHTIKAVDLTTNMVQGSETYYQFNVTGSTDGETFTLLANQMDNTSTLR